MPTYKGNRGNLLQHWVLAELVTIIREHVDSSGRLCFIDAHAMSPTAVRSSSPGQTAAVFDAVASRLDDDSTPYGRAWREHSAEEPSNYPSSAVIVQQLWHGPLNLVLCEADVETAHQIGVWLRTSSVGSSSELHRGDWRSRFREGFSPDCAAYLISFDSYMFDRHGPGASSNPGNMWPSDIVRASAAVLELGPVPVVLQLSTYSANNANSQGDVISSVEPVFKAAGLALAAKIRADHSMMSLVFARSVHPIREARLPQRFKKSLAKATGRAETSGSRRGPLGVTRRGSSRDR